MRVLMRLAAAATRQASPGGGSGVLCRRRRPGRRLEVLGSTSWQLGWFRVGVGCEHTREALKAVLAHGGWQGRVLGRGSELSLGIITMLRSRVTKLADAAKSMMRISGDKRAEIRTTRRASEPFQIRSDRL